MMWIFMWVLVIGTGQYSAGYPDFESCERARAKVEFEKLSPEGRPIEKTHECVRIR